MQEPQWPSLETMISVSVFPKYFHKYCSLCLSVAETGTFFIHFGVCCYIELDIFCIYPISSSSAESKLKRGWSLVHLGDIKVLHVHSWKSYRCFSKQTGQPLQITLICFYHSPSAIVDIIIASLIRLHCFLWISSNQKLWSNKIDLLLNTSVCKLEKDTSCSVHFLVIWCSRKGFL